MPIDLIELDLNWNSLDVMLLETELGDTSQTSANVLYDNMQLC